ncbi:hypothetical protein FACS1894162_1500 [Bacteroidia bacterium]|nr:hypothetical protein FACS1894162_1500 [Bacteroidia bacterium]
MFAQVISTPLFATFEDGNAAPFVLNQDGPGNDIKGQSIVNNPSAVKNTTSKCFSVQGGSDWWHKTYLKLADGVSVVPASANHKYLHIFVYYTPGGSNNGFEIGIFTPTDTGTPLFQGSVTVDPFSGEWQDLVVDLSTVANITIGSLWIRPYCGAANTCYLDEFELSDSPTSRQAYNQWNNPVLATFEPGSDTPFTFSVDGGNLDVAKTNPNAASINETATSLYALYNSMDWWYKTKLDAKTDTVVVPQSEQHKYLHFFSYRTASVPSEVQINNEDATRIYQKGFTNTAVNEWEDLVFDLTVSEAGLAGIAGKLIGGIWIMTNLDSSGDFPQEYYYDEFILSDSDEPRSVPTNLKTPSLQELTVVVKDNTIELLDNDIQTVNVFDLNGSLVRSQAGKVVSSLAKGAYLLQVTKTDGSAVFRKVVL